MEKEFFIIIKKEIEELEQMMNGNPALNSDSLSKSTLLLLYKMYELEKRLKVVESQTKTHWV
jgi:hypothetical protein